MKAGQLMPLRILAIGIAFGVSVGIADRESVTGEPPPSDRAMKMASQATDKGLSAADRDIALSALERLDFGAAVSIAPALVDEEDRILRARAAWILAQADKDSGRHVLRAMAAGMTDESVLAIEALGRLRDAGSHVLLRSLLQQEMSRERPAAGRVAALTQALGDYVDKSDAALLAMAVRGKVWAWRLGDGRSSRPNRRQRCSFGARGYLRPR